MGLSEIIVSNLRCIEHAELHLPRGLTLVHGGNGSGKTSLLEAMFVLGRGRSFRTRNSERLIARGQTHMRVTGQVRRDSLDPVRIGFEVTRAGTIARVAARLRQALAELSEADREILTMRYALDYDTPRIAEALGINVAAVHMRLSRARQRVGERLGLLEGASTP